MKLFRQWHTWGWSAPQHRLTTAPSQLHSTRRSGRQDRTHKRLRPRRHNQSIVAHLRSHHSNSSHTPPRILAYMYRRRPIQPRSPGHHRHMPRSRAQGGTARRRQFHRCNIRPDTHCCIRSHPHRTPSGLRCRRRRTKSPELVPGKVPTSLVAAQAPAPGLVPRAPE